MGVKTLVIGNGGIRPLEALFQEGVELKAALANCKLRMFKAGVGTINEMTNLAALNAVECDYSGYTAGGVTVVAAGDPHIEEGGEAVLVTLPSSQFNFVTPEEDPPVTNTVGGAYVVDAAGKLRGAQKFDAPVNMASDLNSVVVSISFLIRNPEPIDE